MACFILIQKRDSEFLDEPNYLDSYRYNPGDWAYFEFYNLDDSCGFDSETYDEHYKIWFDENFTTEQKEEGQKNSPYHIAMRTLLAMLLADGVFDRIKSTEDFKIFQVKND